MLHQRIVLPKTGVNIVTYLTHNDALEGKYIAGPVDEFNRQRPMVLVFPGGGYERLSPRENEPVALRLVALGIQTVVVEYSCFPALYPTALEQAAEAVAYCREHAVEWHADPGKIAVLGFSAGGHAAGSIGILWERLNMGDICRPDAMILCYPVITGGEHAHRGSFRHLLGDKHDEMVDFVSLEKHVKPNTPPTFLWHTWEDETVPVENSLLLACALRSAGVGCEMHIYQQGKHGLSLSNEEVFPVTATNMRPECQNWIDMAARWLKELNISKK